MAVKKKQLQIAENANGKTGAVKGHSKIKYASKTRIKTEELSKKNSNALLYKISLIAITVFVGICHRNHIAGMFERDRHFSHLSTLERELAFRTEMGLYYSYYKTMIESPTFLEGLQDVMKDNITEYPLVINTLKRFNLYPEVVLALGYRTYEYVNALLKRPTKECWKINRGENLSPVLSCEGLGEPSYFYVEHVFLLNGLMMSLFFIFGTYLSGSMFGGILTVASFFFNHGEATRVQWTPPLRESFAYPFLVLQMFLVTVLLRIAKPSYIHSIGISISTVLFMLPWQFAQFALLTETVAVFATYILGYIGSRKMKIFLIGIGTGLAVSYALMFGNEMLLTSFFFSGLLTVTVIVLLEPVIEALKLRPVIWIVQGILLLAGTVVLKFVISKILDIADDAHIGDIFRSKFSNFKNFHTMLYTCAAEFDFMEAETPGRVLKTLLAPAVLITIVTVTFFLLKSKYESWTSTKQEVVVDRENRSEPNAEIVYHLFQLAAFTLMAVIIMRLKLFWTPHLCLVTSLLASRQFFGWLGSKEKHYAIITVLLACMCYQGILNLKHQWSIMGEFSNVPQEELVEWINKNTHKNAVLAGPMPTMATVKLCTGRPIVNHPHYEDAGLRPGCSMAEIWDIEDEENRGQTPACTKLKIDPSPYFKKVFENTIYQVLRLT